MVTAALYGVCSPPPQGQTGTERSGKVQLDLEYQRKRWNCFQGNEYVLKHPETSASKEQRQYLGGRRTPTQLDNDNHCCQYNTKVRRPIHSTFFCSSFISFLPRLCLAIPFFYLRSLLIAFDKPFHLHYLLSALSRNRLLNTRYTNRQCPSRPSSKHGQQLSRPTMRRTLRLRWNCSRCVAGAILLCASSHTNLAI